jgi:hypothetical protein
LISGWFNDTIGGFTCTKNCGVPPNNSEVMTSDWNGTLPVPYSSVIKFAFLHFDLEPILRR